MVRFYFYITLCHETDFEQMTTGVLKHEQHEMYECQGMQMARQGTQKATQKV